jgi:serine protease 16
MIKTVLYGVLLGMVSGSSMDRKSIGFGVQRLRQQTHDLQAPTTCEGVEEFRFTDAVIDNFAPIQGQQKWQGEGQRYWLNKQFWGGAGYPVFVFIGGEGQESCTRLTSKMYLYDLAQEHSALLVNVEHRFYGKSYPTVDMSTDNLQYLSSQQALADLARVIQHVKHDLKTESSRVITVGGSYPGNMAAWFKLKYPQITYGSIASSAPLIAKTNFYEYMEVVSDAIDYFSGKQCNDAFRTAAEAVAQLGAGGPGSSGYATLETDFHICKPMENEKDLTILLSDLMGNIQGTVQYNNEHNGVMNVTDICTTMLSGSDPYIQFVQLASQYRSASGLECENANWDDTVAYLSNPIYDPNNAARPWTYQTCNEFGYYQTTDSESEPFHSFIQLNLDFYRALCYESFNGWTADPQVEWMNEVYGDIDIAGTNIIFPAGTIDPWHALGQTNSTLPLSNPTENALYILGTAHCNDLYAPANSDPQSLTNARQQIAKQVSIWLHRK